MEEHDDIKNNNIITTGRALELDRCLKLLHIKNIQFEVHVKEDSNRKMFYEIEMTGEEQSIEEVKRIFEAIIA
jgi:hypothetical protein